MRKYLIVGLIVVAAVGIVVFGEGGPVESVGITPEIGSNVVLNAPPEGVKIIAAYETPGLAGVSGPTLHVDIEIEGYEWTIGGLPVSWNTAELNAYLESHYTDMLRQAQSVVEPEQEYPETRYDLGHPLPQSQHIATLKSVNPTLAKPATVTRRFQGENYDVQCFVSQSVVDMWQTGDLQVGDYVIVSFITESPGTSEIDIAIVVDKVYLSW